MSRKPVSCLDLNSCSARQLSTLPGISTCLSNKIIDYRRKNDRIHNLEEIWKIPGVTRTVYLHLKRCTYIEGQEPVPNRFGQQISEYKRFMSNKNPRVVSIKDKTRSDYELRSRYHVPIASKMPLYQPANKKRHRKKTRPNSASTVSYKGYGPPPSDRSRPQDDNRDVPLVTKEKRSNTKKRRSTGKTRSSSTKRSSSSKAYPRSHTSSRPSSAVSNSGKGGAGPSAGSDKSPPLVLEASPNGGRVTLTYQFLQKLMKSPTSVMFQFESGFGNAQKSKANKTSTTTNSVGIQTNHVQNSDRRIGPTRRLLASRTESFVTAKAPAAESLQRQPKSVVAASGGSETINKNSPRRLSKESLMALEQQAESHKSSKKESVQDWLNTVNPKQATPDPSAKLRLRREDEVPKGASADKVSRRREGHHTHKKEDRDHGGTTGKLLKRRDRIKSGVVRRNEQMAGPSKDRTPSAPVATQHTRDADEKGQELDEHFPPNNYRAALHRGRPYSHDDDPPSTGYRLSPRGVPTPVRKEEGRRRRDVTNRAVQSGTSPSPAKKERNQQHSQQQSTPHRHHHHHGHHHHRHHGKHQHTTPPGGRSAGPNNCSVM